VNEQSFTERLQSAIEKHMAGGGVVNMSDTTPDNTDGGNIIQHSFYAEGGNDPYACAQSEAGTEHKVNGPIHCDDGWLCRSIGCA
jgi:hypothetical protein